MVGPKNPITAWLKAGTALFEGRNITIEYRCLPTLQSSREYLETGALMFYGPNFVDVYRRAANYLDKILRGASPGQTK